MLNTFGVQEKPDENEPVIQPDRLRQIEKITGLPIQNAELYELAFRHSSLVRNSKERNTESNERLEFLGDAVLGLVVAEFAYGRFQDQNEGFLTRFRAKLVNKKALADYALAIGLQPFLEMSDDMIRSGGRANPSLLANTFEALLGALYLDHGYVAACQFVLDTISKTVDLDELAQRRENHKSLLLEYAQARGWEQPQYRVLSEEGPGHERTFVVEAVIGDVPYGRGDGLSKKAAEQRAARSALQDLYVAAERSDNRVTSDEPDARTRPPSSG